MNGAVFPSADVLAGRDPQLEKAIQTVLDELAKNPPKKIQRPAYPGAGEEMEPKGRIIRSVFQNNPLYCLEWPFSGLSGP